MTKVKAISKPEPPSALGLLQQDDGADLVGDRRVGVPRSENRNVRSYRRRILQSVSAHYLLLDLRVGIPQLGQIGGARPRVQIFKSP